MSPRRDAQAWEELAALVRELRARLREHPEDAGLRRQWSNARSRLYYAQHPEARRRKHRDWTAELRAPLPYALMVQRTKAVTEPSTQRAPVPIGGRCPRDGNLLLPDPDGRACVICGFHDYTTPRPWVTDNGGLPYQAIGRWGPAPGQKEAG